MKDIKEYLVNENKVNIPQWDDFVDYTGSSDNTIEKGHFCIGAEGKKFHPEYWNISFNNEYENFVKAYKNAGGSIDEEYSKQGIYEVFCNYSGKSEAAKYILLSFARLVWGNL